MVLREDTLTDVRRRNEGEEVDELRSWRPCLPPEAGKDRWDELAGAEVMMQDVPARPSDPVPRWGEDPLDLGAEQTTRAVDVVEREARVQGAQLVAARGTGHVLDDKRFSLEACPGGAHEIAASIPSVSYPKGVGGGVGAYYRATRHTAAAVLSQSVAVGWRHLGPSRDERRPWPRSHRLQRPASW